MGRDSKLNSSESKILVSSRDFFNECVAIALEHRKVKTFPMVSSYLVSLLENYMTTEALFNTRDESGRRRRETLAEMYLKAFGSEEGVRPEQLKRLGDVSLYVSGFFGDSLSRQLVDIDYYAEIGGAAYGNLAETTAEDTIARVYHEFSTRFLEFVDVLTYISQKAQVQTNTDLLRLYDRYINTGSTLARDQLIEKGLLTTPDSKKTSRQ